MKMLLSIKQRLSLLLPVALFVTALPAHAGLVAYTDMNAWTAASSGITSVGFEGLAATNAFHDYSTSTGLVISGLQFQGYESLSSYGLQVVDGTPSWYNFGSGASLKGPSYDVAAGFVPFIHVILPVNTTAFGVDLMTVSPSALTFKVTLAGQSFNVNTATIPTRTFFGVTSDTSIASIDFAVLGTTNGNSTFGMLDNFRFGAEAPTQTPELGTLLLIGSGLIGFRMLRRRRPETLVAQAA